MINGIEPNNQVRLEIDASDAANQVTNHSGQTSSTAGWTGDTGVTLTAVTNPTRTGPSGSQTLQGAYTGGKTIAAAYGSSAANIASVMSPAFTVTPGKHVGYQVSFADTKLIANPQSTGLAVQHSLNFYNSGGSLIGSSSVETFQESTDPAANTPWAMRTFGTTSVTPSTQVPAGAATARVVLSPYDRPTVGGSPSTKLNRSVYVSKLMVVVGNNRQEVQSVPFSDTAAVWQNILGSSISVHTQRGGDVEGVVDDIEAGLLTVVVTDSSLDPATNNRAVYGRKVRVTVCTGNAATDVFTPIFTGRITSIDADYSSTKLQTAATYRPRITITAADAVAELSAVSAPYSYAGTFAEKVRALMSLSTVPFVADSGAASTVKVGVDENTSLWDQLLLARNSFSTAKAYVDGSGNLVGTSFNRNASYSTNFPPRLYASHTYLWVMYNWAKNPSGENPNGIGASTNLSLSQSTAWAGSGTYSIKLTSTATTGPKKFYPITRIDGSDSYGLFKTMSTAQAFACATVKAIAACRVALKVDTTSGTALASSWVDLAAGQVATLKVDAGSTVSGSYNAYLLITKPGTNTDWDTTGDLVYVDKIGILQSPDMTNTQKLDFFQTDIYFDGSYVSPGIDGSSEWYSGSTHEAASVMQSGSFLSYNDYTATMGSKSVVNALMINKRNVSELNGEKTYGPYQNPVSISKFGTAGAEVTVVDGDPTTLGQFYLSKYASPSVYVSELEVDATKGFSNNQVCLTELYDVIGFQNTVSKVYGLYYVIGIEQEISPDAWTIKLSTRPIDQRDALTVGVTNGSGSMSAGPLDVIGPNGRAFELAGSLDLNSVTAPGTYCQTQNTEAASGLNYPPGALAGLLEVFMNDGQTMVWQRYTVYNSTGNYAGVTWLRTFYAGSWTTWRNIGAAGVWTTLGLASGFQAYGTPFQTPQYRIEGSRVLLRGLVQTTAARTATTTFASLSGVPPLAQEIFMGGSSVSVTTGAASTGTAHTHGVSSNAARIDVLATGAIQIVASATQSFAANAYFSLSGISWDLT